MVGKGSDARNPSRSIPARTFAALDSMNPAKLFRRLAVTLDQAGIPYMLTGSFAGTVYGMGRSTLDIDLIIVANEEQIVRLLDSLPKNEFYSDSNSAIEACRNQSMFNLIDEVTGLKIDFIFRKARSFSEEEFRRRKSAQVEGVSFFVVTAEDLIVAKLEWAKMGASLRQMEDVQGILKVRKDELNFAYIDKWVKDLELTEQWESARKLAGLE